MSVPRTGIGESARIYDDVPGNGGEPRLSAVVTGVFTVTGVVVTAAAALLATWMKYKTDRRRELRKERRELYARFQHASAQLWDAPFRVVPADENAAAPPDDAVRTVNESWIAWAKTWMEMSIVASDEVWRITEPLSRSSDRPTPTGGCRPRIMRLPCANRCGVNWADDRS